MFLYYFNFWLDCRYWTHVSPLLYQKLNLHPCFDWDYYCNYSIPNFLTFGDSVTIKQSFLRAKGHTCSLTPKFQHLLGTAIFEFHFYPSLFYLIQAISLAFRHLLWRFWILHTNRCILITTCWVQSQAKACSIQGFYLGLISPRVSHQLLLLRYLSFQFYRLVPNSSWS